MMFRVLKNLHTELSVFLISIVVASIIIVVSHSYWQSSFENRRSADYDLDQARQKYYTALDQKRLLEEFEKQYKQLQQKGIVGKEHRLNWVDTIEKITTEFKIPYLKYRIEQRKQIRSTALTNNYPQIDVFKSTMNLQMQLLHEGDLYTVLNNLQKKAHGLFDIQSCSIIRNPTQIDSLLNSTTDKNFSANCTLNWYTLQEKSTQPVSARRNKS